CSNYSKVPARALLWCVLVAAWEAAWGELRYSVPEEMPKGSFVGDVAKDLALELTALQDRGVRAGTRRWSPFRHGESRDHCDRRQRQLARIESYFSAELHL
uniref:Cadherin N-terminal domain-containing protein n=1 Tax=Calidris pygmaea TaxID=425635 RepID=A0A8C3PK69_9CHAR